MTPRQILAAALGALSVIGVVVTQGGQSSLALSCPPPDANGNLLGLCTGVAAPSSQAECDGLAQRITHTWVAQSQNATPFSTSNLAEEARARYGGDSVVGSGPFAVRRASDSNFLRLSVFGVFNELEERGAIYSFGGLHQLASPAPDGARCWFPVRLTARRTCVGGDCTRAGQAVVWRDLVDANGIGSIMRPGRVSVWPAYARNDVAGAPCKANVLLGEDPCAADADVPDGTDEE
jgi:hypothetical protein